MTKQRAVAITLAWPLIVITIIVSVSEAIAAMLEE